MNVTDQGLLLTSNVPECFRDGKHKAFEQQFPEIRELFRLLARHKNPLLSDIELLPPRAGNGELMQVVKKRPLAGRFNIEGQIAEHKA